MTYQVFIATNQHHVAEFDADNENEYIEQQELAQQVFNSEVDIASEDEDMSYGDFSHAGCFDGECGEC